MMTGAFLHPFSPPTRVDYITVAGGQGAEIWDDRGNRYIDGMASLWYMNVGHGHPRMVRAIAEQAERLATYHTFAPFSNRPAEQLAEKIASISPFDRARVFLATSGSEAVDTAIKVSRAAQRLAGHEEKTIVISREHGYHGTNFGGTSAQGIAANRAGWGPVVGDVAPVAVGDLEAITREFHRHGDRIAAVLTEPMQGAGGVYPPPEGFLEGLRRLCDEHGAYLIFDEVITGFGRMGEWFGAQYYGVTPDMMTFAKAVSSGYVPLGGVVVGPEVSEALESDEAFLLRHGYTYSGHPIAAAAGLEAVSIQEDEGLVGRASHIGGRIEGGLNALLADGLVTQVRGARGIWAVELPDSKEAAAVRDEILDRGVIVRPLGNALAMCPPLVITDEQIDRMVDALAEVLATT